MKKEQNMYYCKKEYAQVNLTSEENILFFGYIIGLVLVPMFLANQLIIGTIVNALLIASALKFRTNKVLVVALVPSIAAFSAGILFGNLTHTLIVMIPFIWAGNAVLMLTVKKLKTAHKNYFYSALAGATGKTIILFSTATALLTLGVVPVIVLTAFGILQFVTAISGAIIVFAGNKIIKKFY